MSAVVASVVRHLGREVRGRGAFTALRRFVRRLS